MKKQTLNEIINTMAITAAMCNLYKSEGRYKENFRECPFCSELNGMEMILKIMGVEFEYEFNDDCSKITAVKAQGIRVEV